MTTVHHPPLRGVDFHRDHEWLWAGLSVALVVLAIAAIGWVLSNADLNEATFVESVEGTELNEEATVGHAQSPGITTQYFGNSGVLYPVLVSPSGFELGHEVSTGFHVQQPGVTTQYFGNSGVLYPALVSASGFEVDHEVTSFHPQSPGITTQYFGYSGELNPDN